MAILSKIMIEHDGKRQSALEWCDELCFPYRKLNRRIERMGADAKFEDLFFIGSFENRKLIEYNGEIHNTYEWDRIFGYPLETVRRRIIMGWTMEEIARNYSHDTVTYHYITRDGITDTERGWAARQGIDYRTYRERLRIGWTKEEAFGFVVHKNKCEKRFSYRGVERSISGWARKLGLSAEFVSTRIRQHKKGLITKKEVLSSSECYNIRLDKRVKWKGKKYAIAKLAEMCGLEKSSFYDRLRKGWTIDRIMSTPPTDTGYSTRMRMQRIKELKRMGILV